MEWLRDMVRNAVLAAASNPEDVERRYRRRSSINRYFQIQYGKMAVAAGASGMGGALVGAGLTTVATGSLLRCVANMTYAYGYSVGAHVEKHDFLGVLSVWLGRRPEDVMGQIDGLIKASRGPSLAVQAAKPMIERVASELFIQIARPLLPYIVDSLVARIIVKVGTNIAPALSGLVLIAIVTKDYANVKVAIRKYYEAKMRMGG